MLLIHSLAGEHCGDLHNFIIINNVEINIYLKALYEHIFSYLLNIYTGEED